MRRTRFMSLLFLVWAIGFFFVPEFRQGLQSPLLVFTFGESLPAEVIERAALAAEQKGDARTLAFAALHSASESERRRLAERAGAVDPSLSWIYVTLYYRERQMGSHKPELDPWVARLKESDPDNAVPYLLAAHQIEDRRGKDFPQFSKSDLLAQEAAWREEMQKAFAAPRFDFYHTRRFELERAWLREHHLDTPATMLPLVVNYPIPSLFQIRSYANLLVNKFGKEAEDAGQLQEAMSYYWTAAHVGQRMQVQSVSLLEKFTGAALQNLAYDRLVPLLRKTGRHYEATTLEYIQGGIRRQRAVLDGRDPLAQSSNYFWAALMVHVFAALVAVFGILTALAVIYVNAKRWVRREKKGRIYQLVTVAENYLPILLFLACLGLYLGYYPYAQNFHHYMTAQGEIHDLEPLVLNTLPSLIALPGNRALPVANPFRPYAWYAISGLVLVVLATAPWRRRTASQPPDEGARQKEAGE